MVPTVDSMRHTYVIDALLRARRHVLVVGSTGTGKTLTISTKLLGDMPPQVQPLMLTFSARTSANQTQDIIGECGRIYELACLIQVCFFMQCARMCHATLAMVSMPAQALVPHVPYRCPHGQET